MTTARTSIVHICDACHGETTKWQGQCPHCGAWNSLRAGRTSKPERGKSATARLVGKSQAQSLGQSLPHLVTAATRLSSNLSEWDRVLGGGLVPGSVTLLGGEPGIGKSTLLLQVAQSLSSQTTVLYASGEESIAQIALRAERLGITAPNLQLAVETELEAVLASAAELTAKVLVIDSIQTLSLAEGAGAPGSITQLRECTAALVRHAKSSGTAVIIVGHVTKEGAIAGPRLLEHLVDVVMYFERDAGSRFRRIRAAKNRFGPANELGFFLMQDNGLREVKNPAAIYLSRPEIVVAGSLIAVTLDGTRPLLVEVQALTDPSRLGSPRRVGQGLDAGRIAMVLAVLHRHGGLSLQDQDVFVNVVGGLAIEETACDLPMALALASSLLNRTLPADLVVFGELGLTGEIRPVTYGEERISEAARLGFKRAVVPKENQPRVAPAGLAVQGVARLSDALKVLGLTTSNL